MKITVTLCCFHDMLVDNVNTCGYSVVLVLFSVVLYSGVHYSILFSDVLYSILLCHVLLCCTPVMLYSFLLC